ncbi:restriction endonuclease subunit S [Cetobacterium somerae]|uniref:restriction endonuclease subunit S n=1 Tax=Cetobacterium somerae TaxID=188913 RepID=UPI00211EDAD0|nr:restriction endonuclease subunit S [Cetobacterium somerae]MCQ9627213.1 restriction endonuclease subunit S [Cetobacterium somerae]
MEELKEGWRRVKLGEIGDIVTGKTPSTKEKDNFGAEYLFLTPKDMKGEKNIYLTERNVSKIGVLKLLKQIIKPDSVCVSCIGSDMGKVCIVKKKCITNQQINSITNIKNSFDYRYIYYKLSKMKEFFHNMAGGTTMPIINKTLFSEIIIEVPPLETQEKIASILSALDDKIEINNEMNKTLEEMAQTLFKRWFIDFDFPNENGEPYRSSGGKMVNSELGEIPEGWEVEELGKISTLSAGGDKPQSFSKIQTSDYTIPIYSNGVENEGLYGFTNEAKIFEKGITVSARGTIGYICLRQVPYVPIVRLVSIIPNVNVLSSEYLYYYLKKVEIHSTGTTQQQLTVPQFKRTKILIPNFEVLKIFTEKVESMINLLEKNKSENKNISLIRDTLLPKLMSGEIEI